MVAFGSFAARPEPTPTTIPEDSSFRKLFTERRTGECCWIWDERDLAEMCCPSPIGNGKSRCQHHYARVAIKPSRTKACQIVVTSTARLAEQVPALFCFSENPECAMRLFLNIDIKTIPSQDPAVRASIYAAPDLQAPDEIREVKPSAALKDPKKVAANIASRTLKAQAAPAEEKAKSLAKAEQRYLKTALDSVVGHVISIAFSVDRIRSDGSMATGGVSAGIAGNIEDERTLLDLLLRRMENALADGERPVLVGRHLVGFDLPHLTQRAIILGVKLPVWWPRSVRPCSTDALGPMLQWSPSRDSWISLDALCSALGYGPLGDVDRSKVYPLWLAGKLDRIWDYSAGDVRRVSEGHRTFALAYTELTDEDLELMHRNIDRVAESERLIQHAKIRSEVA